MHGTERTHARWNPPKPSMLKSTKRHSEYNTTIVYSGEENRLHKMANSSWRTLNVEQLSTSIQACQVTEQQLCRFFWAHAGIGYLDQPAIYFTKDVLHPFADNHDTNRSGANPLQLARETIQSPPGSARCRNHRLMDPSSAFTGRNMPAWRCGSITHQLGPLRFDVSGHEKFRRCGSSSITWRNTHFLFIPITRPNTPRPSWRPRP